MKLSICIPTYNRKEMLIELLDSISEQITEKNHNLVEVTVSDNCSNDGTGEAVNIYISNHPFLNIVYKRNPTNIGPDRNYIKAVEIASGDYAWILGSDDKINDFSLEDVLMQIEEGHVLYLSNRQNYSLDFMKDMGKESFFKKEMTEDKVISLSGADGWSQYFNLCTELGGVCSYLSSFFFKRDMFLSVKDYEDYIGSAYVHVYIIFKGLMTSDFPTIKILRRPIVRCRLGNDSFLVNGYQRIMLDFRGYVQLSSLFENPVVKSDFLRILMKTHPYIPISTVLKMNKGQLSEMKEVLKTVGYSDDYIDLVVRLNRHKVSACIIYVDRLVSRITKRKR